MAWNVDQLRSFTLFLIRKNQTAGITFSEFQNAFNAEQRAYMSNLLGNFQRQQTGMRAGDNTGLIQNETIMTKLSPFINPYLVQINQSRGVKPYDLIYTLGMRINAYKVTRINHDQIWSVKEDVIDTPSVADNTYYYTEYLNYFLFLPDAMNAMQADLDYVAEVRDIVWAYTLTAYGRQVYDANNSVQPLWDGDSLIEIVKRTLRSLGVSFKDKDFEEFATTTLITGN